MSELAAVMRLQERSCRFLAGEGMLLGTAEIAGRPVPAGGTQVSFVKECDPSGRSYLDYELQTAYNHDDGRIAYEAMRCGYDGRVSWTHLRTTQMDGGPLIPRVVGSIEAGRHVYHRYEPATGWSATLPGFYAERETWFSDVLERGEAHFEVADHGETVELTCTSRQGRREQWTLQRSWALCLRGYTRWDPEGNKDHTIEVLDAVRLNPRFWYPTKVESWTRATRSFTNIRKQIEVAAIRQLDDVPADQFAATFPHGTHVTDRVTGTTVRVAAPDQDVDRRIGEQVADLSAMVRYEPPATFSGWRWWAGAAAVLLAAGVALRIRRRPPRRRRTASAGSALALSVIVLSSTVAAQSGWMLEQAGRLRVANPGVYATALVLGCHGLPRDLDSLARRLGCGESRLESISLARISSVLCADGLLLSPTRGRRLTEVIADCRAVPALAVLALQVDALGPMFVVVGPGPRGVVVAWPAGEVAEYSVDSRRFDWLQQHFAGDGILVRGASVPSTWDVACTERVDVEAGWVESASLSIRRAIVNGSTSTLRLQAHEASCECVRVREMIPAELAAGARGELVLEVDGRRLPSGRTTQHLEVAFSSDSAMLRRRIAVTAARSVAAPDAMPAVMPSRVEAVPGEDGRAHAFLTVVVPDGGQVVGWHGSPGVAVTASSLEGMPGGIRWSHRVDWQCERAWVAFTIRNRDGNDERVACRLALESGKASPQGHGSNR